jgi:hypothetical protein
MAERGLGCEKARGERNARGRRAEITRESAW